jgi:peroxiredoxin
MADGWSEFPGARGCTPQSCAFRDHFAELRSAGAARLFGLSTQTSDYQREAAQRLHLPFVLLSDADLRWARALELPKFSFRGETYLRRLTMVIIDSTIAKVFYPVFPPHLNAEDVAVWLRSRAP